MPFLRRSTVLTPLVISLTACSLPGLGPVAPRGGAEVRPAGVASPPAPTSGQPPAGLAPATPVAPPPPGRATGGLIGADGATLVPHEAAGLIGMDGATLAGQVRLPAGLVGPDGASLVGPDGATLVGPDGASLVGPDGASLVGAGRFTLAQALPPAPAELPVKGARVYLADARGRLLADAAGAPVFATTDAEGRFAFQGFAARRNLVLVVPLAKAAALRGLLPHGAGGRDDLAVDLAGTLATGYIEETFVRSAADPLATLEKLTAEAAAEARRLVAAGLAAGRIAPPGRLAAQALLDAATALRRADPAFDAHMAAVGRLLAAGQADMGAGRPAGEVGLAGVTALAPLGEALLIAASADNRVWRLDPDGRLRVFAGSGGGDPDFGALAPGLAAEAPLKGPHGLVADGTGGAVLLEWLGEGPGRRVSHLSGDGRLTPLTGGADAAWAVPGDGGEVIVGAYGNPPTCFALAPGGGRRALAALPAEATRVFFDLRRYGRDATGRVYLGTGPVDDPAQGAVWRLTPATGALEQVLAPGDRLGLSLAAGGEILLLARDGRLTLRLPDGSDRTLIDKAPADLRLAWDGCALGADGTLHLAAGRDRVLRLRDGALAVVAGHPPRAAANATDLVLQDPAGLATAPDGSFFVADRGAHRIMRVAPDGAVTTIAGTGTAGFAGDGGPAATAELSKPGALGRDAAGHLYVVEELGFAERRLRRIGSDGRITTLFDTKALITGLAVKADGTVFLLTWESVAEDDLRVELRRIMPDGAQDVPLDRSTRLGAQLTLALDADGETLLLWQGGRIHSWHPARGLTRDALLSARLQPSENRSGLAVAPDGRLFAALDAENLVVRVERPAGTLVNVAGKGTELLAGAGVDDSLSKPGYLAFAPNGDLLVADSAHRQVKRIPASRLAP